MKSIITLFFAFLLFVSVNSYSQQDNSEKIFRCAQLFGDSITFLNDFYINIPKRKTIDDPNGKEWDVYLMRGTLYRFALCSATGTHDKVLNLFNLEDSENKPCGSSYADRRNRVYFDFLCEKTGIYKVSIRFKDKNEIGKPISAIGILGFIRKVNL